MKKSISLIVFVVALAFLPQSARSAELVTNGGFETGTFSSWTTVNVTTNVWFNWTVTGPTCSACVSNWTNGTSPRTGNFSAWNGWAAGNPVPDAYRLRQDITIPNNPNEVIRLTWWDRLQWDLQTFTTPTGSTLPQFRVVSILNPSNVVLQEIHRFTAPAYSRGQMLLLAGQGWVQYNADLSAYKGQTIRLEFMCTVAQNTIGPGFCEFDDVSVTNFVPTAAGVSVSGRIVAEGGRGIPNVRVLITDASGASSIATTNPFGYYRFDDVRAGETYIVTVNNRKYLFPDSPRVLSINDDLTGVDFTASP